MFASSLYLSSLKTAKSLIQIGVITQLLKITSKREELKDGTALLQQYCV